MRSKPGFDEVMIVNPIEPSANHGVRLMRFYRTDPGAMGYYAQTPEPSYGYAQAPDAYGYYAEAPEVYGQYAEALDPYGYYAEPADNYGYYGEPADMYGYYAEPVEPFAGYYAEPPEAYGYYAEPDYVPGWGAPHGYGELDPTYAGYAEYEPPQAYPGMGYYAEPYPIEGYGPVGYFAEEPPYQPVAGPIGYYGEMPEMPGYAEFEPQQAYPGVSYYGDPYLAGYVRERPPAYNPSCPMPTNVAGFAEADPLEGYVKPSTVNASCEQMTSQPGPEPSTPETFRPLW